MLLSAVLAISSLGQDVIHGAFFSGEQLARSLSPLLLYIGIGILLAFIALEWLVRLLWARRAARRRDA